MKDKQKLHEKSWFKPTIVIIVILLVIGLVKILVYKPFDDLFKKFKQNTVEAESYDMDSIITQTDPYLGSPKALVKIVEFGDFACPYCQLASSVMREVTLEYGDDIFYQFRDFTVVSPQSIWLAQAANCANEQNKFWPMHDQLFQKQGQITESNIYQIAQGMGIEINKFRSCLESERFKNEIYDDFLTGQNLGVQGTPTFFINGYKFDGVPEKENLKKLIDRMMFIEDNL